MLLIFTFTSCSHLTQSYCFILKCEDLINIAEVKKAISFSGNLSKYVSACRWCTSIYHLLINNSMSLCSKEFIMFCFAELRKWYLNKAGYFFTHKRRVPLFNTVGHTAFQLLGIGKYRKHGCLCWIDPSPHNSGWNTRSEHLYLCTVCCWRKVFTGNTAYLLSGLIADT